MKKKILDAKAHDPPSRQDVFFSYQKFKDYQRAKSQNM